MANSIWLDSSPSAAIQQVGPVAPNTSAPPFTFTGDATSGLASSSTGTLDLVTAGTSRATINNTAVSAVVPFYAANGAVGAPSYAFTNDATTGRYRAGSNNPAEAVNGAIVLDWNASRLNLASTIGLSVNGDSGTSGKVLVGGTSPAYTASPSLTALTLSAAISAATAVLSGKVTTYNGIVTAGFGVAAIVGYARVTAQAAANASIVTYTVGGADGSFEVSANLNATAVTVLATTLTCTYTDESNTSRAMILPVQQLGGSFIASGAITAIGAWETPVMHIRAKAATAITISTTTGTFSGVTYTAEGIIKQTA